MREKNSRGFSDENLQLNVVYSKGKYEVLTDARECAFELWLDSFVVYWSESDFDLKK